MKRSFIALLLVFALVSALCLLASCGGGGKINNLDEGMPEENPIPEITIIDNPNDPNAGGNNEDYTDPQ